MYTPNKGHSRHILLFEFHKGNRASSAAKTLKDTCGNDVVDKETCRRWFSPSRFKKDDFRLKDEPRVGCSKKLNSEQLQVDIDENPTCTTRELSKTFNVSRHMTIYGEMTLLRSRELQTPFLDPIITDSDEKGLSATTMLSAKDSG
ncbi:unnamed protein product [Hymenolepis diminuta]|uniref:Mos1 transposase HTH domain-containing protein n=1 Tax=Hymenolepis diminuta TaxID=6216 RepID=A0A564XWG2_HYMDI|nr:unnamed protein product [Hymenolepis diminuta]